MTTDTTLDGAPCPIIDSLKQIRSQWRLTVFHDLQDGERRFGELKRSTGASSWTLSRALDDLQGHGPVDRRMEEDAPVTTYYPLTDKGVLLCPVFDEAQGQVTEWLDAEREESVEGGTMQPTA